MTAQQIQESGIAFEFGKINKRRERSEIEAERLKAELQVHDLHKRQRLDANQDLDRKNFDRVIPVVQNDEPNIEDDADMAGPSLDLFFP